MSILSDTLRELDKTDDTLRRLDELSTRRRPEPIPSNNAATAQPPPELAHSPNILAAFREAIRRCGVVGEETTAATEYLAITSRLLDKPVSVAVKGLSASGKSFTTEQTISFFPDEAVIVMTAMSERALVYNKEDYAHRTLVVYEATALREDAEDNLTAYFVRSLLSEGRIKYPVTVKDGKGGFTTREIVKEGPTNIVLTTTKARIHGENETRLLSLTTNDTPEQTKAIFHALASEKQTAMDKAEWHGLQRWLLTAEHRVTIPYAKQLAEHVPPIAVRLRRDFSAMLSLIRTHAMLHQLRRERDSEGRIIASLDDYVEVRDLVAGIVAEGIGATVSETIRETVEAVRNLSSTEGITGRAVAEHMKLDKGTVSRRLSVAATGGYIRNQEDTRGRPGRWVVADPLPDAVEVLPRVETLSATPGAAPGQGHCTVAVETEGIEI